MLHIKNNMYLCGTVKNGCAFNRIENSLEGVKTSQNEPSTKDAQPSNLGVSLLVQGGLCHAIVRGWKELHYNIALVLCSAYQVNYGGSPHEHRILHYRNVFDTPRFRFRGYLEQKSLVLVSLLKTKTDLPLMQVKDVLCN